MPLEKKAQFVLFGGSAIGAYRCGDGLPWDLDCDVLVNRDSLTPLLQLLLLVVRHC